MPSEEQILDVAIVGAGISGINTAYRLQSSLPSATYTILESRSCLGGTWSLFSYPGVRSDSNLWTFGFAWRPWQGLQSIASGPSILLYLRDSASHAHLDQKIQYNHKLESANWSSETQTWTLTVSSPSGKKTIHTRFLIMCTGYYDYATPPPADIPGLSRFAGPVVHPQSWPTDPSTPPLTPSPSTSSPSDSTSPSTIPPSDSSTPPSPFYASKRIAIIGSGATAITLLPALARSAAHVTMIQRSPSYVASMPSSDPTIPTLRRWLPAWLSARLIRLKYLVLDTVLMQFSARFPGKAREVLRAAAKAELGGKVDVTPHFEPRYAPGEQRLCLCPDGDFFGALREGRGSVVTGVIEGVEERGVRMVGGEVVEADVLVTATGLRLLMAGGAEVCVDGERVRLGERFLWNTTMVSGVPNFAVVLDFANASWTLGADAAAIVIMRVLALMKRRGIGAATPRLKDESRKEDEEEKLVKEGEGQGRKKLWAFNLTSTYVVKARDQLPRTLERAPWQARSTYLWNWWQARFGSVEREMEFEKLRSS